MNAGIACVVDASVLIKLFLQEDESEAVQHIIDEVYLDNDHPDTLIVPDLLYVECANILRSKVRFNGYPAPQALQAIQYLRALNLPTTPVADLVEVAMNIACQYDITAYDAVYIALGSLHTIPVLTADERLLRQLNGSHHDLIRIEDYLSLLAS